MPLFYPPLPTPLAFYDGDTDSNGFVATVANTCYLVAETIWVPTTLTGIRVSFNPGGNGHYDVGIYDSTGTNGAPNNLLAHAAAAATSLATSSTQLTPALIGGNLSLAPGVYWYALWMDNALDKYLRLAAGTVNMTIIQSGTNAGPLPALASSITGLANSASKPILIGIRSGGWS